MPQEHSLSQFVDSLQTQGQYLFRQSEALAKTNFSKAGFYRAVRRLESTHRLVTLGTGLYYIVPLEYQSAGAPPPTWYLDDWMRAIGQFYYVGLLSAAQLHGAAHQQPQVFQVIGTKPLRSSLIGRARIRFFVKKNAEKTAIQTLKTTTGYMQVSTPEATALDLVSYLRESGGLDHVATVLAELREAMKPDKMRHALESHENLVAVQRLGYLLEFLGSPDLAKPLHAWLQNKTFYWTKLAPRAPLSANARDKDLRWRVYINTKVEVDV